MFQFLGPSLGRFVIPVYDQLKYWLPLASAFVLAYKGFQSIKKSIDGWAEALFHNHLSHIQDATVATVEATNKTNELLTARAQRDVEVAQHVLDVKTELAKTNAETLTTVAFVRDDIKQHEEKEMQVWQGVVNTLAVLEDRSGRPLRRSPAKRRR